MTRYDIWPTRQDVVGIDRLENLVLEVGAGNVADLAREVLIVGEIIDADAMRLGLGRDLWQLLAFANRMSAEVLSPAVRRVHYPGGCWAKGKDGICPPFTRDTTGDSLNELAATPELQRAAMTWVFANIVQVDPRLRQGGAAIMAFQESKAEIAALHAQLGDIDG